MTAPLAQIAREIAYDVTSCTSAVQVQARTEAVLRRHWPAARGVVEVTGKSLMSVLNAEDLIVESAAEKNGLHDFYARLDRAAARLRARAVSAPVVVKRPTKTVSTLVVPEDGTYWCEYQSGWSQYDRGAIQAMKAGTEPKHFVARIRRIDTDAPTTWITRTEVQELDWTAADVPAGHLAYFDGKMWSTIHADTPRHKRVQWLNDGDAVALIVLPSEVSDDRP